IYSLILSRAETACHSVTLTYDGILGSCDISSRTLIALAALTETGASCFFRFVTRSVKSFLMFLGVEGFDAISASVLMAVFRVSIFGSFLSTIVAFKLMLIELIL